jgi:hypothetical protein
VRDVIHERPEVQRGDLEERVLSRPGAQVNSNAVGRNRNGPEQTVWNVPRVYGRDLNGLRLVRKEIYSEEAEGSRVFLPIHPDVLPLHDAHVVVKEETTGIGWGRGGPMPCDLGRGDEAVEVSDRDRVVPGRG